MVHRLPMEIMEKPREVDECSSEWEDRERNLGTPKYASYDVPADTSERRKFFPASTKPKVPCCALLRAGDSKQSAPFHGVSL
jgi:hypothetical protein